jgi:diacylglycerol kinase (ATP)
METPALVTPATPPVQTQRPYVCATLIYNPKAGRQHGDLAAVRSFLAAHGWTVRDERTARAGDATPLARAAVARGDDVVVVAGGDGTINEAIQGLAGSTTALGVLPMGTTNVWAREVGLPTNPVAAARTLVDGARHVVDLGRAGDRYFLLMAGLGFDGAVTAVVDLRLKRVIGRGAYAFAVARQALGYQGLEVTLEMDDATVRGALLLAIVGNTRLYGGSFAMTAGAIADDGLLDVVVFPGRHLWQAAPRLLPFLIGRPSPSYYRTRRLRVTVTPGVAAPDPILPVQVDGDHVGVALEIVVAPDALRVIVPRDTRSPIFSQPPLPVAPPHTGDTNAT